MHKLQALLEKIFTNFPSYDALYWQDWYFSIKKAINIFAVGRRDFEKINVLAEESRYSQETVSLEHTLSVVLFVSGLQENEFYLGGGLPSIVHLAQLDITANPQAEYHLQFLENKLSFLTGDESGGSVDLQQLLGRPLDFKPVTGTEATLQEIWEIIYEMIGDHHYNESWIPYPDFSQPISVPQVLHLEFERLGEEIQFIRFVDNATEIIKSSSPAIPPPDARDDPKICVYESLHPSALNSISGNVLLNDYAGPNGPIQVISFQYEGDGNPNTIEWVVIGQSGYATVTTYAGGILTVNSNGDWTYYAPVNPISNTDYSDNFTYTIQDQLGQTDSATQFICVKNELAPPVNRCNYDDPTPSFVPAGPSSYSYTPNTFMDVVNSQDPFTSLREAIISANANADTDAILLSAGTYTLSLTGKGADTPSIGDLDVTQNLIIQGQGINSTFIDANYIDRAFQVSAGVTLTLRDLTIVNGFTKEDGGSILNNGNLNLYNVRIIDNTSTNGSGGGIASIGTGTLTLINSFVEGNAANHNSNDGGGGIYVVGTNSSNLHGAVTIESSVIRDNSTERSGAGIYFNNVSTAVIDNSLIYVNGTVSGNASLGGDKGGGIYVENTVLLVNDSTISCNEAFDGGGIYAVAGNKDTTILTITNSTISYNLADGGKGIGSGTGGGIYADGSVPGSLEVEIINSTISSNEAGRGGAIFLHQAAIVTIENSTITNNASVLNGVTGAIDSNNNNNTITLTSTIVAANDDEIYYDNTLSDDRDLSGKGFISGGNNLIGDYTTGKSDFSPDSSDLIGVDPMLGPLQNNGGSTNTHALLFGSPAIDSGSNPNDLATDQRGETRTDGMGTDIGAYEVQSITPIILDLYGGGANPIVPDQPIFFDVNNDGTKEQMLGWAGPNSAFLVYNYHGPEQPLTIDNISFVSYTPGAMTDLQGLVSFDTNHNGQLDPGDSAYSQFGVWRDQNQNGMVDDLEYLSLSEVGIIGISLDSDGNVKFIGNNTVYGLGWFTMADGKTHEFTDVALAYTENSNSQSAELAPESQITSVVEASYSTALESLIQEEMVQQTLQAG